MGYISTIWIRIEASWNGEFTVHTQADIHGYTLHQHIKRTTHTYQNYKSCTKDYHL